MAYVLSGSKDRYGKKWWRKKTNFPGLRKRKSKLLSIKLEFISSGHVSELAYYTFTTELLHSGQRFEPDPDPDL